MTKWQVRIVQHESHIQDSQGRTQIVRSQERVLHVRHHDRTFVIKRNRRDNGVFRIKGQDCPDEVRLEGLVNWLSGLVGAEGARKMIDRLLEPVQGSVRVV